MSGECQTKNKKDYDNEEDEKPIKALDEGMQIFVSFQCQGGSDSPLHPQAISSFSRTMALGRTLWPLKKPRRISRSTRRT